MRYESTADVMAERELTIVTGPIDSGKTSWCRKLAAANPACGGVLLLKVYLQGQRIGYDALFLPDGDTVPFARVAGREPAGWSTAERVGPFSISAAGLLAANNWLAEAAARPGDIIVDEIGPLELGDGGLSRGLSAVLASPLPRKLYLVVRRDCLETACDHFGISGYTLVDVDTGLGETDIGEAGSQKA
jgi:nucleoside-triphosphatase THEP1